MNSNADGKKPETTITVPSDKSNQNQVGNGSKDIQELEGNLTKAQRKRLRKKQKQITGDKNGLEASQEKELSRTSKSSEITPPSKKRKKKKTKELSE